MAELAGIAIGIAILQIVMARDIPLEPMEWAITDPMIVSLMIMVSSYTFQDSITLNPTTAKRDHLTLILLTTNSLTPHIRSVPHGCGCQWR